MFAIAFTGLARSGKDTAADHLVEKFGFKKLVLSEVLAQELKKQGKSDSKINRSLIAEEMRKRFGNDVLARSVFEKAEGQHWKKVVFTGVHALAEVEFFKKSIEKFFLVAVKAAPGKRFDRRTDLDAQRRERFFARDKHDTEKFELGKVIGAADYTIENSSTIDDLRKAIDELMQKI